MKNKKDFLGKLTEEVLELNEMATVGSIPKNNTKYTIYPEPLGNPSFHISTTNFEVVLQIRDLLILEWKKGKSKVKGRIPSDDKKQFFKWARSETDGINNWMFLLRTWNENNPRYRIGLDTPLPERVLYEDMEGFE